MERSELGKKVEQTSVHAVDDVAEGIEVNRLDESIEVYPLSSMTRQALRENGIATLRELTGYTEDEINYMDYVVDENFRELMTALEREGAHPRPEEQEKLLYGYPADMQETVEEKGRFWEYRLLFGGIIVNYQWLQKVRALRLPEWCAGAVAKPFHEKEDLMNWISDALKKLEGFFDDAANVMNHSITQAVGDSDTPGDVQAIMDSVEELMGIYKRTLLWRQSFSLIDTDDDYRTIMERFFFVISQDAFRIFDILYEKSVRGLKALNDCIAGRLSVEELNIDFSIQVDIDDKTLSEILHDLEEA